MEVFTIGMPGGAEIITILFIFSPLLLTVMALVSILRNEFAENTNKIIWVLVTILLPIIGPILYFAIGRKQQLKFKQQSV